MPRGIGCGATAAAGAEGAVSAQNQPIVSYRKKMKERKAWRVNQDIRLR